ncbi:MAG TPA: hemerythrin domain-containing protein [Flavipsychrobacter sp.]|nr:hemerythrin domain-containing protein [Flavipsychrobacter sp.]
MQQIRFNAFAMIHKALRSMLYKAANDLQQTNFTDSASTLPVFERVGVILDMFDDHADNEDRMIFPPVAQHNPDIAASLEQEHVTDHHLCTSLREGIENYKNASTPIERIIAGNRVFYAFNEFIAFNLQHMNKEETVFNEALWANYSDGEIMAINQKIATSIPPAVAAENVKWMMRAANDKEITEFIKGIKQNAPEPLYNMLTQIAQQELPAHRWEAIHGQISAEAIA